MSNAAIADRRARWAVAAIFLANGTIIGTWAAHIPLVAERLAMDHSLLGVALLAMALGALIAMPLGGAAISRFGSAAVTRGATIALLSAFILPLVAPSPTLLIAALLVFGASNGLLDVAMNAHGVLVENRLARPVMSSFHGMWSLGGLLGAGVAALLLPVIPALGAGLVVIAAGAVIGLIAIFHLLPTATDVHGGDSHFALPAKASLALGALCFLAMSTEGAVLDWSALHLKHSLELGPGLAATGFAAFSASMAAGRFAGDWMRGHVGAVALVRASAVLAAVGLAVALVAPAVALAILGFAAVGLGMSNLVPIFFGAAGKIPGQAPGTAIAAVATMGYTGFLAGPPVIGFVADATSLAVALGLIVLACVLIAAAAWTVAPAEQHAAAGASGKATPSSR
jgi:MFS family permease